MQEVSQVLGNHRRCEENCTMTLCRSCVMMEPAAYLYAGKYQRPTMFCQICGDEITELNRVVSKGASGNR